MEVQLGEDIQRRKTIHRDLQGKMGKNGRNSIYQSSSAAKLTALSKCIENRSICDTKSLVIALSMSLTRN